MSIARSRHGLVEIVVLDRPHKRNALDSAMVDGIATALEDAERDPDVRAVVLTGAGDRAFCAGMDLQRVGDDGDGGPDRRRGAQRYMRFLERGCAKPVVAAVNGTAVAGGLELMLACDLVVVAEHAELGLPEVSRGLVPGAGGTLLPRRIPTVLAAELALTGRRITARRAYEIGLANSVVPAERVRATAIDLAEAIAANSPAAVRETRELMRGATGVPSEEAWRDIRAAMERVLAGPDAREGARAFLEKRAPRWS